LKLKIILNFNFWTGEFYSPSRPEFIAAERQQPIKHDDNLKSEGSFYVPEKSEFKAAERPQQVKPQDNLKQTGN
jgi:hypothetical protein